MSNNKIQNIVKRMEYGPIPTHKEDSEMLKGFSKQLYKAHAEEMVDCCKTMTKIFIDSICPKCERYEGCIDCAKCKETNNLCVPPMNCEKMKPLFEFMGRHFNYIQMDALTDITDENEQELPSSYGRAEREIKLFLTREYKGAKQDGDMDGFEYIKECAKSALKAYRGLCEDGHSGFSIGITKSLLNALIRNKPLTPLYGTDDEWNECGSFFISKCKTYQNNRYSSLFKDVYDDGRITYSDNERFVCVNPHNNYDKFHAGWIEKIINQFPEIPKIEFPYVPLPEPISIQVEEVLSDDENGDFDTIRIGDIYWKDGEREKTIHINRYYDLSTKDIKEIDEAEWNRRCIVDKEIKERRQKEFEERKQNGGFTKRTEVSEVSVAHFDWNNDKPVYPPTTENG